MPHHFVSGSHVRIDADYLEFSHSLRRYEYVKNNSYLKVLHHLFSLIEMRPMTGINCNITKSSENSDKNILHITHADRRCLA
jgi:hypothetical protein